MGVFGNKMAQNKFFVLTNRCIVFFILHEVNGWKLGKAFRLNCWSGFLEKKPRPNWPKIRFLKFYRNMEAWHVSNFSDEVASAWNCYKQIFFFLMKISFQVFGWNYLKLIVGWNFFFFFCSKFVELLIKITPSIIKIDRETKIFGKNCSSISLLLQEKKGIQ